MSALKIEITLDRDALDRLVADRRFRDRKAAIREAVQDLLRDVSFWNETIDRDLDRPIRIEWGFEDALETRRAATDRIAALRSHLTAKYGPQSDSAALVREDRDR